MYKKNQKVRIKDLYISCDGTGIILDAKPDGFGKYKLTTCIEGLVLWIEKERLKDEDLAIEHDREIYNIRDRRAQLLARKYANGGSGS